MTGALRTVSPKSPLTVKAVRVCFLLLLTALLPIRGAVAAALLCPVGNPQALSGMQGGGAYGLHGFEQAHPHDAGGRAHGGWNPHAGHDHGAVDKCHLCSAFCSLTPMMSETPRLPEPAVLSSLSFPDLSTPAPSFVSDGQERPPRTP